MARTRRGDGGAQQRAEESLRAIEVGELPLAAQERLAEVRGRGTAFFTSDLTTPEVLLLEGEGFRPLTQVMGSCFYNVGFQYMPAGGYYGGWAGAGMPASGQTFELETQTEAWNEARRLALARLAEEAKLAGADAVVGVRVQRGAYDWAAGLLEFLAVGTAVASTRYQLGAEPVLSNLSGQEFAKLFQHSYWPAGIVGASTVCYALTGWQQQSRVGGLFSGFQNQELPDFTRGLYEARNHAMQRLSGQAHELEAGGVVGVQLDQHAHTHERDPYTDLIVTVHVLGTAIVELTRSEEPPPVYIALPLDQETR
jgi:uncharacterized protein YbjQ (UPF0145 family)